MQDIFYSEHWNDSEGNPGGGTSSGKGLCISWQNGPLNRGDERKEPNGAFVETVIAIARERLEYYQKSKFACSDNNMAIEYLQVALDVLNNRTKDREKRQVEGTHAV